MKGSIQLDLVHTPFKPVATLIVTNETGQRIGGNFSLPWTDDLDWRVVFSCLELREDDQLPSPSPLVAQGQDMGLVTQQGFPSAGYLKTIGVKLYESALSDEMKGLVHSALDKNRDIGSIVSLSMPEQASRLHAYPWELLHDGSDFLFKTRQAQLVRNIFVNRSLTSIPIKNALTVLVIDPRPNMAGSGYPGLPLLDRLALQKLYQDLPAKEQIRFEFMGEPGQRITLDLLQDRLTQKDAPQILHIDTHGNYGWLCRCGALNLTHQTECQDCEQPRHPQPEFSGYLAFEDEDGKPLWVSGHKLADQLTSFKPGLVVLSACKSGLVAGSGAFNSVAGALIQHGVPAVVAMQYSVDAELMAAFVRRLYFNLVVGRTLVDAVAAGRLTLDGKSNDHWYRPVLYLRADKQNPSGKLFRPPDAGPKEKGADFSRKMVLDEITGFIEKVILAKPGKGRILNMFGLNELGKTRLLKRINAIYQVKQPVSLIGLKDFIARFEQGKTLRRSDLIVRILQRLNDSLPERVVQLVPVLNSSFDVEDFIEVMVNLLRAAERYGYTPLIMIDDYDALEPQDEAWLKISVLQRLMDSARVAILVTSQTELSKDWFKGKKDSLSISALTDDDIQDYWKDGSAEMAQEINTDTGGLPGMAGNILEKEKAAGKTPSTDFAKARPDRTSYAYRYLSYQGSLQGLGSSQRKAIKTLSLLRWFDVEVLKKVLLAYHPRRYHDFKILDYLDLLGSFGAKISLEQGLYSVNHSIRSPIIAYMQCNSPEKYRKTLTLIRDIYRELLARPSYNQKRYLIEGLYYEQLLLALGGTDQDTARVRLLEMINEYRDEVSKGARKAIDLDDLKAALANDPHLCVYQLNEGL